MPIIPVRGLAAKGVLRDPSPYQLDLDAWSGGMNMRFHANKAERAPIFRTVYDSLPQEPVFCVGMEPSTGYDAVIIEGANGQLYQWKGGVFTDVTETGHSNATDPRATTASFLGDVLYVNRPDKAPRYLGPTDTQFHNLPNMESTWTCRSLRAWGDYMIALGVVKPASWTDPHTGTLQTGGSFPTLFKWSDLTLFGQTPGSWDYLDPTTSAGENPIEDMTSPIVDGLPLRSDFVIYSEVDIFVARNIGGPDIFGFDRLFSDGGLLAPNCMVEVDGVHYCFGPNDIYRHDGVSKQSIIDKRNRDTVFRWLNKQSSEVCTVSYMPRLSQIAFCYNSGDPEATFQGADRCNIAAIYDIPGDTWSFVDLPNVSAFSQANLDNILTGATCPDNVTYATIAGSAYDQDNSFAKHIVAVSGALAGQITNSRLMGYDFVNKGELAYTYAAEINPPASLTRTGIDLDELGSDLATYKTVRRVFPLVNIFDNVAVQVDVGGALTPTGAPTYAASVSFNPNTQYKVDLKKGGRYLAITFTVPSIADFEVVGFDLDVVPNGSR